MCSKWFADDLFDKLGLPTTWLHNLYQASLGPVRLLWHFVPRQAYAKIYELAMRDLDVNNSSPGLAVLYQVVAREFISWARGAIVGAVDSFSVPLLTAGGVVGATIALTFVAAASTSGKALCLQLKARLVKGQMQGHP